MKLQIDLNWISADLQARINLPPIMLAKQEEPEELTCDIIKLKIRRNPASAWPETYKFKMTVFENFKPE